MGVAREVSGGAVARERGELATSAGYLAGLRQEFPEYRRVINALGRQR